MVEYSNRNSSNSSINGIKIRSCRSNISSSNTISSNISNSSGIDNSNTSTLLLRLTRLHVFTAGCHVYQISNHCSWPPLASLLYTSPTNTPPTGFSPAPRGECVSPDSDLSPLGLSIDSEKGGFVRMGGAKRGRGWFHGFSEDKKLSEVSGTVRLHESARKTIFRQICGGLKHLHDYGLLHGDLNCSNVLVNDKLQVKLAGYGPCCLHTPWKPSPGESCDPPLADPYDVYIPPEIMARRSYRGWKKSSDIWCLGMTLLHMTLGEVTQHVNSAVRLRRSKQFKTFCLDYMGYQLSLLLEGLLQLRPVERPCIETVLEHPWLSDGTDLAHQINMQTKDQRAFRIDGRTFPLPKRIRQAFPQARSNSEIDLQIAGGNFRSKLLLSQWQWSCQDEEGKDENDDDVDDHADNPDEECDQRREKLSHGAGLVPSSKSLQSQDQSNDNEQA
ncbi:snf1-related protein kinase [Plakobranchus ocellatus]|uniref:Snf1-related protein kinase n=1 Tax=Plakobranchus ocellatus TaxID=259542 RepID=A0AAV3Y7N8_9GAST|nr:snf1-related protein kinase [Plakobranchus ocellatus]